MELDPTGAERKAGPALQLMVDWSQLRQDNWDNRVKLDGLSVTREWSLRFPSAGHCKVDRTFYCP